MKNLNNAKISVINNQKVIRKGSQLLTSSSFNNEINKLSENDLSKFSIENNVSSIQYVSDSDFEKFVSIVEKDVKEKIENQITEKIRKITYSNGTIQNKLANDYVDPNCFIESVVNYFLDRVNSSKDITVKSILTAIQNGKIY